jgi:CBS domain-containing protein
MHAWSRAESQLRSVLVRRGKRRAHGNEPIHERNETKEQNMKVKEIITPNPQCISPAASLIAAQKMKTLNVGILPVCENDRLGGTVTDRDITVRGLAARLDPKTTKVRQVMTPGVVYCFEDQSVEEAAQIMEDNQIRRLPVLNQSKRMVGIVSLGDLAVRGHQETLAGEVLERVSEPVHAAH